MEKIVGWVEGEVALLREIASPRPKPNMLRTENRWVSGEIYAVLTDAGKLALNPTYTGYLN